MKIKTIFGEFTDLKVDLYCDNEAYILATIEDKETNGTLTLGFDAPIEDDNVWRYWIESEDVKGNAQTFKADITEEEKRYIQELYYKYKNSL